MKFVLGIDQNRCLSMHKPESNTVCTLLRHSELDEGHAG